MGVEQNCMSNEKHFVCQKKQLIGDEHVQLQRALQVAEKETI